MDPRDIQWELHDPCFRVHFVNRDAGRSREFEVTGADDVNQTMEWADANVEPDEVRTVYVVVPHPELGVVRLAGPES